MSLLQAMLKYNITIHRDHKFEMNTHRKNDKPLMEYFIRQQYSTVQLKHINICRQYQRVIYMSDIIGPNGITLHPKIRERNQFKSKLKWPDVTFPAAIA